MSDARLPFGVTRDPAACPHRRFRRIGIQHSPISPRRLYLLTCTECGTTITTRTLRDKQTEEEPEETERARRRAG